MQARRHKAERYHCVPDVQTIEKNWLRRSRGCRSMDCGRIRRATCGSRLR
jgi:hypothetical protein